MTTIESATRLVAEAMATTALDYDVLADDGIDGLSAHEVLIEYSDDGDPAGTLTPDCMDATREYLNMVFTTTRCSVQRFAHIHEQHRTHIPRSRRTRRPRIPITRRRVQWTPRVHPDPIQ